MLISVSALSYAAAGIAFFALFVSLVTRWRLYAGTLLVSACLTTALWSVSIVLHPAAPVVRGAAPVLLELLRNVAWIIFLLDLLVPFQWLRPFRQVSVRSVLSVGVVLVITMAVGMMLLSGERGFFYGLMTSMTLALIVAVVGMLLVEQVFRNVSEAERWGIKFACFGIGGMFAYDFYLYSDAVLFRHINDEIWNARGIVNALTVPLIVIAIARQAQWRSTIAVSRRFLFHSVALSGAALYLLCMAGAGYYLRYFGGSWGIMMQVAFLFGALLLLVAVMFSGTFRSWLKVFISKHFYTYNYDYREEWIRFTRTLSEQGNRLGERVIEAIAQLVESPGGALWIVRESGECEQLAYWNMFSSLSTEPVDGEFCRFLEQEQWIIDLQGHAADPSKYGNLQIPSWITAFDKASLIVPLILHGKLFGFVVLAQPRSSIRLNWEVLDLLKITGSQAAGYLALSESGKALMVARQFESFNRMSTFVVHDLKNVVAQLSLLVSNAQKHKDSPEFQEDMLETITYSTEKMKLLLQKFSRNSLPEHPYAMKVHEMLQQVIAAKKQFTPSPVLHLECSDVLVFANPSRLERVISHLVQNAIEATGKGGNVTVRLRREEDFACIEVADTGHGMSAEFIEQRLFKPFESTKPAGMGIGVFEMREYILELGGKVEVTSVPSQGTTFKVILPACKVQ